MPKPGCTRRPPVSVAGLSHTRSAELYFPFAPIFLRCCRACPPCPSIPSPPAAFTAAQHTVIMHSNQQSDVEVGCVAVNGVAGSKLADSPRVLLTEEDVEPSSFCISESYDPCRPNSRAMTEQTNSPEDRQGHFDPPDLGLLFAGRPPHGVPSRRLALTPLLGS